MATYRKTDIKEFDLTEEQWLAVMEMENWWIANKNQVFEITGPAGSGKTTIIKKLIDRLYLSEDQVLFLAFTGKAASQITRSTGYAAQTIHSAIYELETKVLRDENGRLILTDKGKPIKKKGFVLKEKLRKDVRLIVIDEGSMVSDILAEDLLSFGIPTIVLGDLNQLPPVIGNPYFLKNPNIILTRVHRQAIDNPIIKLSQDILNGETLKPQVLHYKNKNKQLISSIVKHRKDLTPLDFRNGIKNSKESSMILTGTNRLRFNINNFCRENIKKISKLEYPNLKERVICRRNNWSMCINKNIYLTNGMTGYIENVDHSTYNGRSIEIDFRPDFVDKSFKRVKIDYKHLFEVPGGNDNENPYAFTMNKFEFAYAITVHAAQGNGYDNVLYLHEKFMSGEDERKLLYTAITRAIQSITIVL